MPSEPHPRPRTRPSTTGDKPVRSVRGNCVDGEARPGWGAAAQLQLACTQTMSDLIVSEPLTFAPLAAASAAL